MLKIAGVCGSLRAASYNRMLMHLAESLMPASMQLDVLEWRDVPVFDADVFAKGFPPQVSALRERVRAADGLLFVTPEYNFSIPGGLKNVIDWLSRGEDQQLSGKPVAMLTATTAAHGPSTTAMSTPPTACAVVPSGIGTLNIITMKLYAAPIATSGT